MIKIIKKRFDENCINWDDSENNLYFLRNVKEMASLELEKRGCVFLRDIYENIGIPITRESCIFGWHKDIEMEHELFKIIPIEGTNDYELIFKAYTILNYLPKDH